MKPWSEENFLERLIPQLRREDRRQVGTCPDSATLLAFTEGQIPPFLREAVTAHLRQCPECSEVCARLVNFAQETMPEQDSEWINAEKRLKNWIDPFLLSRAANSKPPTGVAQLLRGKDAPKAPWWKLPAMGIAAVFLVVAGLFFARHGWVSSTPEVATRQAPPQVVDPAPVPTVKTPENGRQAAKPANPTQETSSQIRKNSAPIIRKSTEPGFDSQADGSQPETLAPQTSPRRSSPPANIPNPDQSNVTAQGHRPPDLGSNDRILSVPESASLVPSGPVATAPVATHASRPAISAKAGTRIAKPMERPERLRLQASTQLWIRVVAISRQSDGSFEFDGRLLQPVSDAGGVLLDQGTEVNGSGSVKETVTTLSVRGFVTGGVRYVLPAGTGTVSPQPPGTGKAVQFSKGKILQMWISSETVYEKADKANSPDPGKP